MPSVRAASPSKKTFRTVLGFSALSKESEAVSVSSEYDAPVTGRRSVDSFGNYIPSPNKKPRAERRSATDHSLFDSDRDDSEREGTMKNIDPQSRFRRGLVRMETQDGPWTISVAENPHSAGSFVIYVKTPTHNLTLTRPAVELLDLHHKLRESHPSYTKLPPLPIDAAALPTPPTAKRKSAFLNTLSRLASPSGGRAARDMQRRENQREREREREKENHNHVHAPSTSLPSSAATPIASPSQEVTDPFTTAGLTSPNGKSSSTVANANANVTGIAAYLTTLANDPTFRANRNWKRFVRVRTDDLESVRVERAIKRVRSDLAAHVSPSLRSPVSGSEKEEGGDGDGDSFADTEYVHGEGLEGVGSVGDLREEDIKEEEEGEGEGAEGPPGTPKSSRKSIVNGETETSTVNGVEDDADGGTPNVAADHDHEAGARIPRSQSADPLSSSLSSMGKPTGDESPHRVARKKRSTSSEQTKDLTLKKRAGQRKVVIDDFEMIRVLGKGCAGKVLLVRYRASAEFYALKAITKRHVLAHQELQHTLTEQAVLKRMAAEGADPFVVKLWWSFHDKENLFLVMDFHPGGDLATQLARWGRLGRDRARFYAAEIVEGVEGLHAAGVIYRDLKPENILIGADGHIVLTDFGLSKEFPRRPSLSTSPSPSAQQKSEFYSSSAAAPAAPVAPPWMRGENREQGLSGWAGQPVGQHDSTSTFCGTAEYLAPEVIQGLPYSYEVDWWSFGTMLYEMLTGITPFWANNHSDMYVRVLQDELQFPDDRSMDQDTKSLIRGLLQRNPALRMCEPRIKKHPYFSMIDWSHVYYKRYIPPYIPPIDPSNASDTQNFDDTFLEMEPVINDPNEADETETDTDRDRDQTDTDRTDGDESVATPSQSRSPSVHHPEEETVDVFDGYSFKGRHSVIIDESDSSEAEAATDEEEEVPEVAEVDVEDAKLAKSEVATVNGTSADDVSEKVPDAAREEPASPSDKSEVSDGKALDNVEKAPAPPAKKPSQEAAKPAAAPVESPEVKPKVPAKPSPRTGGRFGRGGRREKSGIPALDRYLSDGVDEDEDSGDRDDEDDDWDFIEAGDGEEQNGSRGTTLFARGVVDRYKLAIRKGNAPSRTTRAASSSKSNRSDSQAGETTAGSPSPSASEKQRRGRNPGLVFRKNPRQFLQQKSPQTSQSSRSVATVKSLTRSNSVKTASVTSPPGSVTPSSTNGAMVMSPSLRSKESAASVGNASVSSDQSGNGDGYEADDAGASGTVKGSSSNPDEPEKQKNKLKKYKENAEKVFSIFSPPR